LQPYEKFKRRGFFMRQLFDRYSQAKITVPGIGFPAFGNGDFIIAFCGLLDFLTIVARGIRIAYFFSRRTVNADRNVMQRRRTAHLLGAQGLPIADAKKVNLPVFITFQSAGHNRRGRAATKRNTLRLLPEGARR